MVTQNNEEPIDFDYNLYIQKTVNIKDEKELKETVRKVFNIVLKKHGWADCQDSTSSLTTEKRHFKVGIKLNFVLMFVL